MDLLFTGDIQEVVVKFTKPINKSSVKCAQCGMLDGKFCYELICGHRHHIRCFREYVLKNPTKLCRLCPSLTQTKNHSYCSVCYKWGTHFWFECNSKFR